MAQREVRLGLVLYGGVSLAIYENGIAQEIYRAVCGEGVYKLIRALIDSDIVVDVISGTSAGGVNGVMMGYCLANGFDFLPAAQLWRDEGDIQKLLRKPEDTDDSSLLDSAYYQDRLTACYADTLTFPKNGRVAPAVSELDLFVTGTDAHGVVSTVYDELGHPIDVKNHRALFQLQYRGERKNDFSFGVVEKPNGGGHEQIPVTASDLARLSRLTSGFPVAFKPTRITEQDRNFFRWGRLSGPAVYMDGGILNNKPFTSTIGAIASRTATREVERFLIYVEPRPEEFEASSKEPAIPTAVEAGMSSLLSIPSYQSIAADLQAIEEHNERALQFQKIIDSLGEAPEAGVDCLAVATVLPAADDSCGVEAYLTSRLLLVKDAAVEAILDNPDGKRDFFPTPEAAARTQPSAESEKKGFPDDRRSGRLLVQSFWHWKGDAQETLANYDIFFRKRRVDRLSNVLMEALKRDTDPMAVPGVAWEAVNHFFKLYEITEWAMRTWLTKWISGWKELSGRYPDLDTASAAIRNQSLAEISHEMWGRAKEQLDRLLACGVEVPKFHMEDSAGERSVSRDAYYAALKGWIRQNEARPGPGGGTGGNLLEVLDEKLKDAISLLVSHNATAKPGLLLCREFCRFIDVDRQLLPLQIGSGFESTNVIRVVRFSPLDAQRGLSKGDVKNKVRGSALANFGAFFKKGWRANDIMVGRFDAVCLLTECLLTKERLAALAGKPVPVSQRMIEECLPKANAAKLANEIAAYFATPNPPNEAWEAILDEIVLAAQREVVDQEWKQVARCTIEQQYAWAQYKDESPARTAPPLPTEWTAGKASPDELLVKMAAHAIANGNLPAYAQQPSKEFLEEVPLTSVQEHASLAMVRLGRSLGASVPSRYQQSVKESIVFKVTMRWVPNFFYRLTYTRRTQPNWTFVPVVLMFYIALIALVALAWKLKSGSPLSMEAAALTTALSLAAAIVVWTLTQKRLRNILLALIPLTVLGAIAGYILSLTASERHRKTQLVLSFVAVVGAGAIPFRTAWGRILSALVAFLLLFLIWRANLGM